MDEARRTGSPASVSACKAVQEIGTITSGRMGQPQSSDVSRSSEGGVIGAMGRRVQVGPLQGQGCAGFAGTEPASASFTRSVRSTWLGNSQPARAAEEDKRATPSNASGTLTTRTRCRTEVRTSESLVGFDANSSSCVCASFPETVSYDDNLSPTGFKGFIAHFRKKRSHCLRTVSPMTGRDHARPETPLGRVPCGLVIGSPVA